MGSRSATSIPCGFDWNLEDSVKAAMRAKVRRLVTKYDYPPDTADAAVELVLEEAEQYALAA